MLLVVFLCFWVLGLDSQALHKVRVSALKATTMPRILPVFHDFFLDSADNVTSLNVALLRDNTTDRLFASAKLLPAWAAAGLSNNDSSRIVISAVNTATQYNSVFRAIFLQSNTTTLTGACTPIHRTPPQFKKQFPLTTHPADTSPESHALPARKSTLAEHA